MMNNLLLYLTPVIVNFQMLNDSSGIGVYNIVKDIKSAVVTGSTLSSVGILLVVFFIITKAIKKITGIAIIGAIIVGATIYFKSMGVF